MVLSNKNLLAENIELMVTKLTPEKNINEKNIQKPLRNSEKTLNKKPKSLLKGIEEIYHDYCSKTSIHGIQYIGESRPLKEKLFWLSVFVISIYCCSNLISSIYVKWNETPVIVSFSEKSTPVWSIPFPAITICSETKRALKSKGMTYANFFGNITKGNIKEALEKENITEKDLDEFRTLLQICNTQLVSDNVPRLTTKSIDYFEVLESMLPMFSRYFFYCKWFSHFGECDELFTPIFTEEGICFTFNGLNATDLYREDVFQHRSAISRNTSRYTLVTNRTLRWSLEDGYATGSGVFTYPARVLAAGARAGLFIALQNFKQEVDYSCRGAVQGFKVLLHSPDDVPLISKQFVRIPMGKEVLIAVKPNMITTAQGIAEYHPLRRQCFLNSERSLRFFKTYTQSNCELECLTNFTLRKCGCVKFSMPRLMDTPVCTEQQIHCYDSAEDDLLLREFDEGIQETTFNYRGITECNCMPACTSLVYNTEMSQGTFDLTEMLQAQGDTTFFEEYPGAQMSRLSIYFKENQFITSKRSELYGVTDFLANCGGIFGLFMGFSILSMVEVIYYFSLRLWTNMIRE